MRFWLAVILLAVASPCQAKVKVIDGDSLVVDGREIRLSGIDAPEYFQFCYDAQGLKYECGKRATQALRSLAGADTICETLTVDRYNREVAVCTSQGKNLNLRMVELGWAVAYDRYTHEYDKAQEKARRNKKGIWQGRFMKPELYRALKRK